MKKMMIPVVLSRCFFWEPVVRAERPAVPCFPGTLGDFKLCQVLR